MRGRLRPAGDSGDPSAAPANDGSNSDGDCIAGDSAEFLKYGGNILSFISICCYIHILLVIF